MPGLESVRELLQRRGVPDAAAKRDALASTRPPPRPGVRPKRRTRSNAGKEAGAISHRWQADGHTIPR